MYTTASDVHYNEWCTLQRVLYTTTSIQMLVFIFIANSWISSQHLPPTFLRSWSECIKKVGTSKYLSHITAHIFTNNTKQCHITPILKILRWIPAEIHIWQISIHDELAGIRYWNITMLFNAVTHFACGKKGCKRVKASFTLPFNPSNYCDYVHNTWIFS